MTSKPEQTMPKARSLRVLVVDNKPVDRIDHVEDLKNWGYTPVVAEGEGKALIEDAMRKAREQRCHAAIVDKRLYDDRDISDRSGLELVLHLKPARGIVVTGYGSVPDSRKVNEYGVVMVGKEEGPEAVRIELNKITELWNPNIRVVWPFEWSTKRVTKLLPEDDRNASLIYEDEADSIVARLFPGATRVELRYLDKTAQSTLPENISPFQRSSLIFVAYEDDKRPVIVKLMRAMRVQKEIENYEKHIRGYIKGDRYPVMKAGQVLWNLGGIVYHLVGKTEDIRNVSLLTVVTFSDLYRSEAYTTELTHTLRDFYSGVWGRNHQRFPGPEQIYLFSVELDLVDELDTACPVSARLHDQFQEHEEALASQSRIEVEQAGTKWTIVSADRKYLIQRENQTLNVYERTLLDYQNESLFDLYDHICRGRLSKRATAPTKDRQQDLPSLQRLPELPEPYQWAYNHRGDSDFPHKQIGVIHGDLHGNDLLIGERKTIWIVDFEDTGVGPVVQDYVSMEIDLLTGVADIAFDFGFVELCVTLLYQTHLGQTMPPTKNVVASREHIKAYAVIMGLREIANDVARITNLREYYWGLLLQSLYVSLLLNPETAKVQWSKTIFLASLICQRLEQWGIENWLPAEWGPIERADPSYQQRHHENIKRLKNDIESIENRLSLYGSDAPAALRANLESLRRELEAITNPFTEKS